jgi:perosamine synthetase
MHTPGNAKSQQEQMVQAAQTNLPHIPLVQTSFPAEYADCVRNQVLSGFIGPGQVTSTFAAKLAEYAGVPYCILTVSGTIALSIAAKAVGLEPGDEILVPAYGVISTINAFASIGLKPRLVDIEKNSGSISLRQVERVISSKTKSVCYVNFSGYTGQDLLELGEYCSQNNIPLIEDAACALGQMYNGTKAGAFGHVGTYSFSVPKILTTGQGGALVTADEAIYKKAAAFIDHGDMEWRRTNLNREIGTNLRFTDIQSTLGLAQLRDIEERLQLKRSAFKVLKDALGERLFDVPGGEAPLHNIVFSEHPDQLVIALTANGVSAVRPYRLLSQHPAYQALAASGMDNSQFWTDHAVYLPFGLALTPQDAERIVATIEASGISLLSIQSRQ